MLLGCVTVRKTVQLMVLEAFTFEDRIKIHKQHLLEWVSLLIFTDLTFSPGREGRGRGWGRDGGIKKHGAYVLICMMHEY